MIRILKLLGIGVLAVIVALGLYGAKGWWDARGDADDLATRADGLIERGLCGGGLGETRLHWLLMVQDPGFFEHRGVDVTTPGAGLTTVTQSLAKRLAFEAFHPGLAKIRQTGYALGLEQRLTKQQIIALFLDTVPMGRGPDGWMTGFYTASQALFHAPASEISDDDFIGLLAVMIAPGRFDLGEPDDDLRIRIARIRRLVAGECAPADNGDVWLEGCG